MPPFSGASSAGRAPVPALPAWLELDGSSGAGLVTREPARADVELPIDERLVTSFYAR